MAEYNTRLDGVRGGMAGAGIDTLLVHIPENIFYLTGHQTVGYYAYQCLALPAAGDPVLSVRGLERDLALSSSWLSPDSVVGYSDTEDSVEGTIAAFRARGLLKGRVGIERGAWFIGLDTGDRLAAAVDDGLVDGSGFVEACRLVKSPAEIALIRQAAQASDAAVTAGVATVAAGVTEQDVAAEMYAAMIRSGGEYTSLPLFIASGPRAGLGHATWSDRVVEAGDTVFLETCGTVNRYSAAMIRAVVVGEKEERMARIESALVAAVESAMAAMVPGATASDVDAACRAPVIDAGFGDYFTHRAGYSIGINFPPDWGEGHIASLRSNADFALEEGMVFHVIPAVLDGAELGVGISETVMVTASGGEAVGSVPRKVFTR